MTEPLEFSGGAFTAAVARFRAWAATVPEPRSGEWECDYRDWRSIYDGWANLLAAGSVDSWSGALIDVALYAIARDNEMQHLVRELPRSALPVVATHALSRGEPDAKWQLAAALADVPAATAEPLLLRFVDDADEYVRRRALGSLARIGSPQVTELALREWEGAPADMPWTRMNALWALHRVGSSALAAVLADALAAPHPLLAEYARKIAAGNVDR